MDCAVTTQDIYDTITVRWRTVQLALSTNPLIQSVIHKSFQGAISDIGLPEFPFAMFAREITPYLKTIPNSFDEKEASLQRLWRSVLQGEVIATEVSVDDALVFFVRGAVSLTGYHLRLTCRHGGWVIETAPVLYERPFQKSRGFRLAILSAIMLVAGIVGYVVHRPKAVETARVIYVTRPASQATTTPPAGTTASLGGTNATTGPKSDTTKTVILTLSLGMPLYDFAKMMVAKHLVKNALAFDMLLNQDKVDTDIKPGAYRFVVGMSENQLIHVLQKGPIHP